ncbi:unnamed protein product [Prorocentrum cordatum]|uniref:FHA domain-containing protein n=1 Tax=Prorocentrum cordatum TaxID=2364126 RepID=A0ABN9USB8_9DINO|nr:unnamed protein product [Polarella glacialis]
MPQVATARGSPIGHGPAVFFLCAAGLVPSIPAMDHAAGAGPAVRGKRAARQPGRNNSDEAPPRKHPALDDGIGRFEKIEGEEGLVEQVDVRSPGARDAGGTVDLLQDEELFPTLEGAPLTQQYIDKTRSDVLSSLAIPQQSLSNLGSTMGGHCASIDKAVEKRVCKVEHRVDLHDTRITKLDAELQELRADLTGEIDPAIIAARAQVPLPREQVAKAVGPWPADCNMSPADYSAEFEPADKRFQVVVKGQKADASRRAGQAAGAPGLPGRASLFVDEETGVVSAGWVELASFDPVPGSQPPKIHLCVENLGAPGMGSDAIRRAVAQLFEQSEATERRQFGKDGGAFGRPCVFRNVRNFGPTRDEKLQAIFSSCYFQSFMGAHLGTVSRGGLSPPLRVESDEYLNVAGASFAGKHRGFISACADDLGGVNPRLRPIAVHFQWAQKLAALSLETATCFIAPLSAPFSAELATMYSEALSELVPEWSVFVAAPNFQYLGMWVGPECIYANACDVALLPPESRRIALPSDAALRIGRQHQVGFFERLLHRDEHSLSFISRSHLEVTPVDGDPSGAFRISNLSANPVGVGPNQLGKGQSAVVHMPAHVLFLCGLNPGAPTCFLRLSLERPGGGAPAAPMPGTTPILPPPAAGPAPPAAAPTQDVIRPMAAGPEAAGQGAAPRQVPAAPAGTVYTPPPSARAGGAVAQAPPWLEVGGTAVRADFPAALRAVAVGEGVTVGRTHQAQIFREAIAEAVLQFTSRDHFRVDPGPALGGFSLVALSSNPLWLVRAGQRWEARRHEPLRLADGDVVQLYTGDAAQHNLYWVFHQPAAAAAADGGAPAVPRQPAPGACSGTLPASCLHGAPEGVPQQRGADYSLSEVPRQAPPSYGAVAPGACQGTTILSGGRKESSSATYYEKAITG